MTNQLNTTTTPIPVDNGGTGVTSFTAYEVICGGTTATGALQSVGSTGNTGEYLTGAGASALPSFVDYTETAPTTALNYNQTTPAVRTSLNVTSVSDDSAGIYTITIATDYANVNYRAAGLAKPAGNGYFLVGINDGTKLVGSLTIYTESHVSPTDSSDSSVVIWGGLV